MSDAPKALEMGLNVINALVLDEPCIAFYYQIDIDAPNAKNDEITLIHNESQWRQTILVEELHEIEEDWVELIFDDEPPQSGTFSMMQDPKDGDKPYYIFVDQPYEDITELTANAEEDTDDVEDEPEDEEEPFKVQIG